MTEGHLYLCPTPIGNLEDITLRVLRILSEVDLIACEDTRQTVKLLNHYEIKTPLTSYYEHNKDFKGKFLIEELKKGKKIALVSDAGMPGIQDPGEDLVRACIEEEIAFEVLPGAVALIVGLISSGIPTKRFSFEGFIPREKREKKEFFQELEAERRTMIFYESPHRILKTLEFLKDFWPERKIAVCREMTKKFQEIKRASIEEAYLYFKEEKIRGEFCLVIEGNQEEVESEKTLEWAVEKAEELIALGIRPKDALKQMVKETDFKRNELYDLIMIKKD